VTIGQFQKLIRDVYFAKDRRRGIDGTFRWFTEEVGELARGLRQDNPDNLREEFADVFAWLVSLASLKGIDLEAACAKYAPGCPKCHSIPCNCQEKPGSKEAERP